MFFRNEYYNKVNIPASKARVNLNIKTTSREWRRRSKKKRGPFGNIISVVDGNRITEKKNTVEKKTPTKILILANSILENFCYYLKKELEENKFECTIQHTKLKNKINDTIFLITPTLISYIPEKFYYFQVEQLNGISTDSSRYKAITTLAKKSIQTFDYSKMNIKYYPKNIHVEYFPFNFSPKISPLEKKYDILFFGCTDSGVDGKTSNRRKKILLKLAGKFKINVPKKFIYGKELTKIINQSKIMLNLHFYDNAILETARLQEGVGLNTHIISEYPCEEDMEAIEPYKNRVEFVEIIKDDLSNIHLLEEKIEELLKGEKEVPVWENKIGDNTYLIPYYNYFPSFKTPILCIIPARSGSKGIPNKNIKLFCKKPLLAWSIEHAKKSVFNNKMRIVVSTDSKKYQKIALEYGAEAPFLRPKNISGDYSTDYEFIKHALDFFKKSENYIPEIILQLRPTYPTRKVEILDECLKLFIQKRKRFDSLRTVIPHEKSPYKMYKINDDNSLKPLFSEVNNIKEPYNNCRQILPKTYLHNGYIDILNSSIIKNNTVSGDNIFPYVMSKNDYHDIDNMDDWNKGMEIQNAIDNLGIIKEYIHSNIIPSENLSFFENKKIILVGNGPDGFKASLSNKYIDSHDIVVRINSYKIIPNLTGTKTTIHVMGSTDIKFHDSTINPIYPVKNKCDYIFHSDNRSFKKRLDKIVNIKKPRVLFKQDILSELSKKICNTKKNCTGPSCLILFILITLKTNCHLNYIGFGKHQLNAKGNQEYYWGERVLKTKKLGDFHSNHGFDKQHKLLKVIDLLPS